MPIATIVETDVLYYNTDSYCGPISCLVQIPPGGYGVDEELLVFFRENKQWPARLGMPAHRDPSARTSLLRSRDRGRSWFSHVTPMPFGGNGAGAMRLADGALLLNACHWQFAPSEDDPRLSGLQAHKYVKHFDMWAAMAGVFMTRSETDGYTWQTPWHVPPPEGCAGIACHSPATELPDGELLLPVTAKDQAGQGAHCVLLRSLDGGRTWCDATPVTQDDPPGQTFHESRIMTFPSGRMIAMHRTQDANYFMNVSTDGGHTWSNNHDTGVWCHRSSPPAMTLLADGRLLLTRGYRDEPYGVRCHISEDEGRTWSGEIVIRDDGGGWDMGYPSTVEFGDGELMTVYYWYGEDHIRHFQRTHWRLK